MYKPFTPLISAVLAGGLALSLASIACAQDAGAQAGQPASAGARAGGRWGDPAQMKARMQERRQRRLQTLHDALGLRPDQETAWQTFAASSQRSMEGRKSGPHGPGGPGRGPDRGQGREPDEAPMTTPERLDRMAKHMAEMQARLEQRATVVKAFYSALDQRQQKTFDALFTRGRGGPMGHRHGFGGEGGGPGWGR